MRTPPTATSPAEPSRAVVEWRRERLRRAGFAPAVAHELARDRDADLHAILDLLDRGCPPDLAVRIAAPLDVAP
jgi:hypothetical protein